MIPQEKRAAVVRALHEAFGVTGFEDIRQMTKGHTTALVFRILVRGTAYLLRIIMRPNTIVSPERQFTCMRAAAEAGLAPRIRYISVEDGISITDFVEEVPFPPGEARVRMPLILRTLHALPPFPRVESQFNTTCLFLLNKGPAVDGFFQRFQAANILSKSEIEELSARYAQLAAVYPHHEPDIVSSHNDLFKPDNTLFDGHRVWLVDWEAAFLNDRYADLAVVANLIVTSDAEETAYLQQYFGQPPDEYQRARFFLMRQITHIFYAMVFLSLVTSGEPLDQSEKAPDFNAFQRSMWSGEVNLADKHTKFSYGSVHWQRFLRNTRQLRWDEALKIVSDRYPHR